MHVRFRIGVEENGVKKTTGLYGKNEGVERFTRNRAGGEKAEGKGVTECNDNVRFMQPCTAEELANAVLATFSRPLHSSLFRAPSRCSCFNAVAVGRKPRRKETSRIASRSFVRRSLSAKMHRCPCENFGLAAVSRAACCCRQKTKGIARGDREVTKVSRRQITNG